MNASEALIRDRLRKNGWEVLRNGWPDFMCRRITHRTSQFLAVEVKSGNDCLSKEQVRMQAVLREAGIRTCTVHDKGVPVAPLGTTDRGRYLTQDRPRGRMF